jgi:hypothetical protein
MTLTLAGCAAENGDDTGSEAQKTTIAIDPLVGELLGNYKNAENPITGLRGIALEADGTYSANFDYSAVVKCAQGFPDCGIYTEKGRWEVRDLVITKGPGFLETQGVPGSCVLDNSCEGEPIIEDPVVAVRLFELTLRPEGGNAQFYTGTHQGGRVELKPTSQNPGLPTLKLTRVPAFP